MSPIYELVQVSTRMCDVGINRTSCVDMHEDASTEKRFIYPDVQGRCALTRLRKLCVP